MPLKRRKAEKAPDNDRPQSGISEEWRDIVEWEGLYQISNLGNVKSLARNRRHPCKDDMILSGHVRNGYKGVVLKSGGKNKSKSIHRLVVETFLPNPHNLPQVNHKDGDKLNNVLSNLEWCTASENQIHAIENGLINHSKIKGSNNYQAREGFVKSPFGQLFFFDCMAPFCDLNGLDRAAFQRLVVGKQGSHLGWKRYEP